MEKICTSCSINDNGLSKIVRKADWVLKKQTKHPPEKYIPEINELITVSIDMGKKFAGRYIYYFASENEDNFNKNGDIYPEEAYDDYENSGLSLLDSYGNTDIVLYKPVEYYVEKDNKIYPSHIHFIVSNKLRNNWLKKKYTVKV